MIWAQATTDVVSLLSHTVTWYGAPASMYDRSSGRITVSSGSGAIFLINPVEQIGTCRHIDNCDCLAIFSVPNINMRM